MALWLPWRRQANVPQQRKEQPQAEAATLDPLLEEEAPRPQPEPAAVPVHVLAGDAVVRCREGRLIIERPDAEMLERPLAFVSALHVHGWATVTAPCIRMLLEQGTPIIWRSPGGYPVGMSAPLDQAGAAARRAQYKAAENGQALLIAREFVTAKIENIREFVRRRDFPGQQALRRSLKLLARKAQRAPTLPALLGFEGTATAQYFAAFDALISARGEQFVFEGRTRRPPRDAVNALMSYAYAVLLGECLCAAAASGLDPRQGFLHAERAGRPALALDLMEPFRPLIADAAVLAGINRGQFEKDGFISRAERGVMLSGANRKSLLALMEERLAAEFSDTAGGEMRRSFRQAIGHEAIRLAAALASGRQFKAWRRA